MSRFKEGKNSNHRNELNILRIAHETEKSKDILSIPIAVQSYNKPYQKMDTPPLNGKTYERPAAQIKQRIYILDN